MQEAWAVELRDGVNRFMGRRPLALFSLCYAIGALVGYYGSVPIWLYFLLALGMLVAMLVFRRRVLAFALALMLGALVAGFSAQIPAETPMDAVHIQGRSIVSPVSGGLYTVLTLDSVRFDGETHKYPLRVYVYGQPVMPQPGDSVSLLADTFLPQGQRNPGGFDFRRWLWLQGGVLCASGKSDDFHAERSEGFSWMAWTARVREKIALQIERVFPSQSPLVEALILGDKRGLSDELTEDFRLAGLAHLLAISGLHVSALAMALSWLLHQLGLSRRWAFLISLSLLILYAGMIGFPASVLRALTMFAMLNLAPLFGRPNDTLTALCFAMLFILFFKPLSIGDAGFQLSFSAVFSMLALKEPVAKLLHAPDVFAWPGFAHLRLTPRWLWCFACQLFCVSIAIQLGTLPVMVLTFGSTTPLAPLVNLIAIPLTTLLLPLIIVKLTIFALLPALSPAWFLLPDKLLQFLVTLADQAARIRYSSINLPSWPIWLGIVYVAVCAMASPFVRLKIATRKWLLCSLPLLALLSILLARLALPGGLFIGFLDAGQADATVIRAEGSVYMVDVGKPNSPSIDYLVSTGQQPRAVFLTHPHLDHAGGLLPLVKRMQIETIYLPECWDRVEMEGDIPLQIEGAEELGSKIVYLKAGDVLQLSNGVRCEVLQPKEGAQPTGNGASLVLQIVYGEGSALLMGDLPSAEELPSYPDIDVLKAAHHGARSSNSEKMLHMTKPSALVISVGNNGYGHPAQRVLDSARQLGATLYRTDECGAVFVDIQPDGVVKTRTFLKPEVDQ